jgi:hypothetical protein
MAWKDAAAQIGTGTLVNRLAALKGTMRKRDFKRLVATTVAQLLEVHPDLGRRKARRWARKATGTRPGKIGKKAAPSLKATAEAADVAAVTSEATRVTEVAAKRRRPSGRARLTRSDGAQKTPESEAETEATP